MSLYNQLFGTDPRAKILLGVLGLRPEQAGRIRDAYVDKDKDGRFVVVLFTRNGGANRRCWEFDGCVDGKHDESCMVSIIASLQSHPLYLRDYDAPEDDTYASFEFKPPADKLELVEHVYAMTADKRKPIEKFNDLIEKIQKGDMSDPEVVKALNIGRSILNRVTEAIEKEQPLSRKGSKKT